MVHYRVRCCVAENNQDELCQEQGHQDDTVLQIENNHQDDTVLQIENNNQDDTVLQIEKTP